MVVQSDGVHDNYDTRMNTRNYHQHDIHMNVDHSNQARMTHEYNKNTEDLEH